MQNGFPSASKKFWPRPGQDGYRQDGIAFLFYYKDLFHSGNIKSMPDEAFDPEPTEPGLHLRDVLSEMELEVVVPWRGSLHWSHFCRVSCSRALKLANSLRNDVDLPKVNLAEKCSPLLGEHFPLNRCQAQPVKRVATTTITFYDLHIKQPRWSSLPPTFNLKP